MFRADSASAVALENKISKSRGLSIMYRPLSLHVLGIHRIETNQFSPSYI